MDIYFLGTGAGMPSRDRNVTSIALELYEERGTFWMFDCGEGTQHQILRSRLKLSKLEMIFITHMHGDHIYGLPGLLTSRSYQGGTTPVHLFGPPGIKSFLKHVFEFSQSHPDYPLVIHEHAVGNKGDIIGNGVVFEDERFKVVTAFLEHRIPCYGYRIEEKTRPGKLLTEKLTQLGIPPGPIYANFKKFPEVVLPDGRKIKTVDYLDVPIPGRVVAIMGDTRICDNCSRLSRDADVLVHEATFSHEERDLAYRYHHATSTEVARMAQSSGVAALIMTHISSRYKGDAVDQLVAEAKVWIEEAYVAEDLWSLHVPRKDETGKSVDF